MTDQPNTPPPISPEQAWEPAANHLSISIDHFTGPFRFLSNFWPTTVTLDGVAYHSVEHAYQAAKTLDPGERARIQRTKKPSDAKRLGRAVPLRPDWAALKIPVMRHLLRQKFTISELRNALLRTAPHPLIEGNTWGDRFWGVCEGEGTNWLGRLLMEIREKLRP